MESVDFVKDAARGETPIGDPPDDDGWDDEDDEEDEDEEEDEEPLQAHRGTAARAFALHRHTCATGSGAHPPAMGLRL